MKYRPLQQTERIELIDALRGFALLGILMVNIQLMYEPMTKMILGAKPGAEFEHIVGESVIKFFFEGKFYVIFSMLFGFGFYMFLNKSQGNGIPILPIFRRRLFFLLLFGFAHILLVWAGDILAFYAFFGFLLILFRKASDKKILRWAVVLALLPTVLMSLMVLALSLASQVPEVKAGIDAQLQGNVTVMSEFTEKAIQIYSSGSFSEIVNIRIQEYLTLLSGAFFFFCPMVLSMFLMGFYVGRRGFIHNYENNLPLFRRIFCWSLCVGIFANLLYTLAYQHVIKNVPDGWSLLSSAMHSLGGVSMGLCYVSGIIILFIKGKAKKISNYLVPIGRMALTNYLLQSIVCAFIFHSYGLGYYGKVDIWHGIFLAFVIFILQIIYSRWWLNRFYFGPLEWLWRSLTYFKIQPMKKS